MMGNKDESVKLTGCWGFLATSPIAQLVLAIVGITIPGLIASVVADAAGNYVLSMIVLFVIVAMWLLVLLVIAFVAGGALTIKQIRAGSDIAVQAMERAATAAGNITTWAARDTDSMARTFKSGADAARSLGGGEPAMLPFSTQGGDWQLPELHSFSAGPVTVDAEIDEGQ